MYYHNYFSTATTKEMKKMLSLIIEVVRFEAVTELTFDYLKVLAPSNEDKLLLNKMLEDEREHFKVLKKIYFHITGQSAAGDPPPFIAPEAYLSGIEEIFYEKLQIIEIYKKMKQFCPYVDMSEQISFIIYDELSHLPMLNHLLIRSKMNGDMHDYSTMRVNKPQLYS